jgi:hypothetical protein
VKHPPINHVVIRAATSATATSIFMYVLFSLSPYHITWDHQPERGSLPFPPQLFLSIPLISLFTYSHRSGSSLSSLILHLSLFAIACDLSISIF